MRVSSIRNKTVVFTIEEFGTTRQDSLVLGDTTKARRNDSNPDACLGDARCVRRDRRRPGAGAALPTPNDATVVSLSVVPRTGRADVVVRVDGSVTFKHFTLAKPDKIVVDIAGATLGLPDGDAYDGVARGGITRIRYSQFTKTVVRVVLTLDAPHAYTVSNDERRAAHQRRRRRPTSSSRGPSARSRPTRPSRWRASTPRRRLQSERRRAVNAAPRSRSAMPKSRAESAQRARAGRCRSRRRDPNSCTPRVQAPVNTQQSQEPRIT